MVASVDTYLRFAEAANRLGVGASEPAGLPDLMEDMQKSGSKDKAKGMLDAAHDKYDELFGEEDREAEEEPRRSKRREEQPAGRKERS